MTLNLDLQYPCFVEMPCNSLHVSYIPRASEDSTSGYAKNKTSEVREESTNSDTVVEYPEYSVQAIILK